MPRGNAELNTTSNPYNMIDFIIRQSLLGINTCEPVEVVAINGDFVDVKPLVYQIDGENNSVEQRVIYSLPFIRLQSGENGILINPQVGDLGLALYCQRDISAIKKAKKASIPSSKRVFNKGDGVFIGGLGNINKAPTRFIEFTNNGVIITGNNSITLNGDVSINGDLTVSGNSSASDHISGGISGKLHVHGGVEGGDGVTDLPE